MIFLNDVLEIKKTDIEELLTRMVKNITGHGYLVLSRRNKNDDFCYQYGINNKLLKKIISNLKYKDLSCILPNEHKGYEKELLYVFAPIVKMIDIEGRKKEMQLYIKLNYISYKKTVIVVSIHEADYKLGYYFKEDK